LLTDIAQEHPEPVINHVTAIAQRLTDELADVRQKAAMTLLRAGGADPAAVEAEHDYLAAALDDSDPAVRVNACTLVGNAHAPVSTDRLRELRNEDPDERVRDQAAWALNRLS
jgi:HEAT repeat protein